MKHLPLLAGFLLNMAAACGFQVGSARADDPTAVAVPLAGVQPFHWRESSAVIKGRYPGLSCEGYYFPEQYDLVCTKRSGSDPNERFKLLFKGDKLVYAYVSWVVASGVEKFEKQQLAFLNGFYQQKAQLAAGEISYRWRTDNAFAIFSCPDVFCILRLVPAEDILARPRPDLAGPVGFYDLELGSATTDDLARVARANNWRVKEQENTAKPPVEGAAVKEFLAQNIGLDDLHSLKLVFRNNRLAEISYWFVDPGAESGQYRKTREDYFGAFSARYGEPVQDDGKSCRFSLNRGAHGHVSVVMSYRGSHDILRSIVFSQAR
jgi:hypothetical protein